MEKTCSKRPTSIVHRSHEATNRTGLAVPCLTWRSYVPQQTHEHSQHPGTPPHAGARTTTGRDVSAFRCPGWPTLRQLGPGHVGRNPIYQEILRCHQEMVDVDWKLLILDSTFWVAEAWERIVCHSAFNLKCWQIVCEKSPNPDVGVQIHPKPPHREQSLLLDSTSASQCTLKVLKSNVEMWLTHSNRFNNYLYVTGVYLPRTWLTGPHVFSFGSWTLSESTWGVVELWMLHCSDICMKYTEILSEDVWTIVSSAPLSDLHTYVGAYMCCLYCLYMFARDIKDIYNQELQSPDVTKIVHIYSMIFLDKLW